MTRLVGTQDRDEFILDPALALRRGRKLDAMLASAPPARGRPAAERAPLAVDQDSLLLLLGRFIDREALERLKRSL